MKILAVTGPPSGGKSTFVNRIATAAGDLIMNNDLSTACGVISTGRMLREHIAKKENTTEANELRRRLDLGCMFPDETMLNHLLGYHIACLREAGATSIVVDGLPRIGHQAAWVLELCDHARFVIVQPSPSQLRINVGKRDTLAQFMQPQREALWYGEQYHSVVDRLIRQAASFTVVENALENAGIANNLAAWLTEE